MFKLSAITHTHSHTDIYIYETHTACIHTLTHTHTHTHCIHACAHTHTNTHMQKVRAHINECVGGEVDEKERAPQDAYNHNVNDHTQNDQHQILATGAVLSLKALALLLEIRLQKTHHYGNAVSGTKPVGKVGREEDRELGWGANPALWKCCLMVKREEGTGRGLSLIHI